MTLELWLGAYEAAMEIFREAIDRDRRTRWAWIGAGAAAMLQGDLALAQSLWTEGLEATGAPGPTLFVYRGECLRRQGELTAARRDLETALRQKPQRLSAWINLALVDAREEVCAAVLRECDQLMPLLVAETTGSAAQRLEAVLLAMRGNRSSLRLSYYLWDRLWSVITRGPVNVPDLLSPVSGSTSAS